MQRKIQVVSFQMPFPANYGGVIDVYYKLKALHDAGAYVILHTFIYDREINDNIKKVADEIYYYPRKKTLMGTLSLYPFIVNTRRNDALLKRIEQIDAPVLLEGLHTCALLKDLHFKGVRTAVRTHNIEHEYYEALSKATDNPIKKILYKIESLRLKRFESILKYANVIFPLSCPDKKYFEDKFSDTTVKLLYPFFNDSDNSVMNSTADGLNVDVLYHGNLDVVENRKGLIFILNEVLPLLDDKCSFVVAGKCSSKRLVNCMLSKGVHFVNHPSDKELDTLISSAKVNLLISFQSTGIKLKLLNALSKGNGVSVVNSHMVSDDLLRKFCMVADTPMEIAKYINEILRNPVSEDAIKKQREDFSSCFNTVKGAKIIIDCL